MDFVIGTKTQSLLALSFLCTLLWLLRFPYLLVLPLSLLSLSPCIAFLSQSEYFLSLAQFHDLHFDLFELTLRQNHLNIENE